MMRLWQKMALVAVSVGMAALSVEAFAQTAEQDTAPVVKRGTGRMARDTVAKRLGHLTRRLGLTPEQRAEIKPILEAEAVQLRAIRADGGLTRDERRQKIQAQHDATYDKIHTFLTPEQQQKHDALRDEFRERRRPTSAKPAPAGQ
ncbi:MAG: hypothetical protein GJT30_14580 [Geobacter sp.]|nr:hypothetical protein [Geobacter sp.]MSM40838.1 hypothetical protein [Geobacter sp.]